MTMSKTKAEYVAECEQLEKRLKILTDIGNQMSQAIWRVRHAVGEYNAYHETEAAVGISAEWDKAVRDA